MAKEWLYLIGNPVDTIKTIILRKETQILDDFAPTNYLGIPLVDAVKAFQKHKQLRTVSHTIELADADGSKPTGNGVLLKEWPGTAQDEMTGGQVVHPDGRSPEHPNI